MESAKHFEALQKARAKSGGTLKAQKLSKSAFKLQSEPQIVATAETEWKENSSKSFGCYDGDCHRKKGRQETVP